MLFRTGRLVSLALPGFLAALGFCLGACPWVSFLFGSEPIEPFEVVGTWEADYDQQDDIRVYCDAVGLETLVLRPDGTYQQVYHDGRDHEYIGPWDAWYWEERERGSVVPLRDSVIHLTGGRLYPLGVEAAEQLANGHLFIHLDDDGRSWPLDLDGSEVILHVLRDSESPGGIVLEYPPVCDPDGFARLRFHRVSEHEPATDSSVTYSNPAEGTELEVSGRVDSRLTHQAG